MFGTLVYYVLFENNLFKGIGGILLFGKPEYPYDSYEEPILNEISARNVKFQNNVFTNISSLIKMRGQGFLVANGIYSTQLEDKFKFYNNVVIMYDSSNPGTMGWNEKGFIFGNNYEGMVDPTPDLPSKTLSRIDSMNNCYINENGEGIAFLKHWVGGSSSIMGISVTDAINLYNVNGEGDLFPSDISQLVHFNNITN